MVRVAAPGPGADHGGTGVIRWAVWHFATWRAARRVYRTRGTWAAVWAEREAERVRLNRPVIR